MALTWQRRRYDILSNYGGIAMNDAVGDTEVHGYEFTPVMTIDETVTMQAPQHDLAAAILQPLQNLQWRSTLSTGQPHGVLIAPGRA